ncbi:hypothetical protein AWZ03_013272 [Drosophila navojoa]|uniref:Uncharacterized protein n=1 Tax=Drosophila navojoa TaxID=7232 RepID=A0A484AV22_DRONA|nr:hypothetical protein AWZ03_013272 [Drosophila navojoa]
MYLKSKVPETMVNERTCQYEGIIDAYDSRAAKGGVPVGCPCGVDVYCDCCEGSRDCGSGSGCDSGSGSSHDASHLMVCCDRFGFRLRLRQRRQRSFEYVIAVVVAR